MDFKCVYYNLESLMLFHWLAVIITHAIGTLIMIAFLWHQNILRIFFSTLLSDQFIQMTIATNNVIVVHWKIRIKIQDCKLVSRITLFWFSKVNFSLIFNTIVLENYEPGFGGCLTSVYCGPLS